MYNKGFVVVDNIKYFSGAGKELEEYGGDGVVELRGILEMEIQFSKKLYGIDFVLNVIRSTLSITL